MSSLTSKEGILLESGTNEVEFIEFSIGDVSYGINVAKVQRVIALTEVKITRVDNASSSVIGVIHIHEKPVLLIDLRKALGIPPAETDAERQLVLVARFNKITTAYLIDAVNKIHRTSWTEFEPLNDSILTGGKPGYVTGTIKIQNRVILILDLEHLMLDFIPQEKVQESVETPIEKKARREHVRIVYAEDSPMIRKIMLKTLAEGGFTQIKAFEHGKAACEYINQVRKQAANEGKSVLDFIDCIITDIEMPQMDGLTLCKNVKESTEGHIPSVVVYSSLVNDEMARKCKSVGADAQISKPHGGEILDLIDKLCLETSVPA